MREKSDKRQRYSYKLSRLLFCAALYTSYIFFSKPNSPYLAFSPSSHCPHLFLFFWSFSIQNTLPLSQMSSFSVIKQLAYVFSTLKCVNRTSVFFLSFTIFSVSQVLCFSLLHRFFDLLSMFDTLNFLFEILSRNTFSENSTKIFEKISTCDAWADSEFTRIRSRREIKGQDIGRCYRERGREKMSDGTDVRERCKCQ